MKRLIKIIVDSQELKDKILSELEYVLRSGYVDTTKASTLRHFYTNPDIIESSPNWDNDNIFARSEDEKTNN